MFLIPSIQKILVGCTEGSYAAVQRIARMNIHNAAGTIMGLHEMQKHFLEGVRRSNQELPARKQFQKRKCALLNKGQFLSFCQLS